MFKSIARIFEKFLGPLIGTEFGVKETLGASEPDVSEDLEEWSALGQSSSQPSTLPSSSEDPQRMRALQATYTNKCKQAADKLIGTLLPKLAKQCQNFITMLVSLGSLRANDSLSCLCCFCFAVFLFACDILGFFLMTRMGKSHRAK